MVTNVTEALQSNATPPSSPEPRRSRAWAIAAVCIVALLVFGFLANTLFRTPERLLSGFEKELSGAFKPNVTISTTVFGTLGTVKKEAKLVVMSSEIDIDVAKKSEMKVLWDTLDLGDTVVRIRAFKNKVQYYLPVEGLSEKNFRYDAARKKLIFQAPAPRLDFEMVDVQSNPEMIEIQTDVGWARLKAGSGAKMEKEARIALRPSVIREGASPVLLHIAQENAEKTLKEMFKPLTNTFKEGVELEIQFDELK